MARSYGGRLRATLQALADGDCSTAAMSQRLGWTVQAAHSALSYPTQQHLVLKTGNDAHGRAIYALTDRGRAHLQALQHKGIPPKGADLQQPAAPAEHDPADTQRRALKMLAKAAHGLDSGALAEALKITVHDVEQMLQPHVDLLRLVTCKLERRGQVMTLYRWSMGNSAAGAAWIRTDRMASGSRPAGSGLDVWPQRMQQATTRPQGLRQVPPAAPAADIAPALAPAIRDTTAEDTSAAYEHQATELVVVAAAPLSEPAPETHQPAAPETPQELDIPVFSTVRQLFDGVDMDDIHRKHASASGQRAPGEFSCALWSSGALVLDHYGRRIHLSPEHTLELLQYLDAMRQVNTRPAITAGRVA